MSVGQKDAGDTTLRGGDRARLLARPSGPRATAFAGPDRRPRERIVGVSAASRLLEETLARAAQTDSTVLITGETGCGKEQIARALHASGGRADRPFVAINCGAMAATLIESQLFGHEKGSFTGAFGSSQGVFRAADGGIVFLDEIGEMPLDLQPRLLRALQEREVTPIGSTETFGFDVQVIVATNRDLRADVAAGRFREDLYWRINTIEISVPPLRDRSDDIPLFVAHFCRQFAAKMEVPVWDPDQHTIDRFRRYPWPGNVRQLAQTIERAYALGSPPVLPGESEPAPDVVGPRWPDAVSGDAPANQLPVLNLEALRRMAVKQALAVTDGHKGQAAALLGVHINTMTRLVDEALPIASQRRKPRRPR